jgi:hypothetical protein
MAVVVSLKVCLCRQRPRSDLLLYCRPDPSAASYTLPDGAARRCPPETTACTSLDSVPVGARRCQDKNSEVKFAQAFAERDCLQKYKALLVGRPRRIRQR